MYMSPKLANFVECFVITHNIKGEGGTGQEKKNISPLPPSHALVNNNEGDEVKFIGYTFPT